VYKIRRSTRDIIGGPKIKNGSRDLDHAHFKGDLSSVCCELCLFYSYKG